MFLHEYMKNADFPRFFTQFKQKKYYFFNFLASTKKDFTHSIYLCIRNKGSMGEWLKPAHCKHTEPYVFFKTSLANAYFGTSSVPICLTKKVDIQSKVIRRLSKFIAILLYCFYLWGCKHALLNSVNVSRFLAKSYLKVIGNYYFCIRI